MEIESWLKIEILAKKIKFYKKRQILAKTSNLSHKKNFWKILKFWLKIENLGKNRFFFGQKSFFFGQKSKCLIFFIFLNRTFA